MCVCVWVCGCVCAACCTIPQQNSRPQHHLSMINTVIPPFHHHQVLPTGKNMHALDPQSIPTTAAVDCANDVVNKCVPLSRVSVSLSLCVRGGVVYVWDGMYTWHADGAIITPNPNPPQPSTTHHPPRSHHYAPLPTLSLQAVGAAQDGQRREVPRDGRLHALGHGQHQDVRGVPRAGT